MVQEFKILSAGVAATSLGGVGMGIGTIFGSFLVAASSNPGSSKVLFNYAIIGFALTEAMALFALWWALCCYSVKSVNFEFLFYRKLIKLLSQFQEIGITSQFNSNPMALDLLYHFNTGDVQQNSLIWLREYSYSYQLINELHELTDKILQEITNIQNSLEEKIDREVIEQLEILKSKVMDDAANIEAQQMRRIQLLEDMWSSKREVFCRLEWPSA